MRRRMGCRNILMLAGGVLVALILLAQVVPGQQLAALPTRAVLAVPTEPPTATEAATSAPPTVAAGATVTATPTATIAATVPPSATPTQTAPPGPAVTVQVAETYYTRATANLRSCPRTDCDRVGTLQSGAPLTVDGVSEGEAVAGGNAVWYRVAYAGGVAYVYSNLVTRQAPATAQPAPVQRVPAQPTQPPAAPAAQWNCGGDLYNCSDFSSRAVLMSYFNTCPGDPSRLDNNNDGVPCENLR